MSSFATTLTAEVFVTTYGVAAQHGFATGKFFDLTAYESKQEFLDAAHDYALNVLRDNDAELCFPDYSASFKLRGMISECGISAGIWELFEFDSHDIEILEAYLDNADMVNNSAADTLEHARERYAGHFESLEDYAEQHYECCEELAALPETLRNCIDMTEVGRRLTNDMSICNGHYFHSY